MIIKKGSFKIDMFGAVIYIYLLDTNENMVAQANRIIKRYKEKLIDFPCHGLTFAPDLKGGTYYLFLSCESLDVNTIAHENDHIRNYILDYYVIDEQNDSNEISANMAGYINEKVFKFIKSANHQIEY